jgi:Mrp family chromosome partitioning ATPase
VRVVVITGPPGAGKSSVLAALADALSDDDVPHAALDIEMVVWTHPALTETQWTHHVRRTCELFREAGHQLLLLAQTLETDADRAQLLTAIEPAAAFIVRLEAEPDTLAARITRRESPAWSGLAPLVEHARELAATMSALNGVDLILSTEGRRPEHVAARILAARAEWLSR